jgi:hypothetical protein
LLTARAIVFELNDNINTIKAFPNIQTVEETYVCLQKFFNPVDKTTSILMPAYTSDICHVLIFNSGDENEKEQLIIGKNEFEEYSEEGIKLSVANRFNELGLN